MDLSGIIHQADDVLYNNDFGAVLLYGDKILKLSHDEHEAKMAAYIKSNQVPDVFPDIISYGLYDDISGYLRNDIQDFEAPAYDIISDLLSDLFVKSLNHSKKDISDERFSEYMIKQIDEVIIEYQEHVGGEDGFTDFMHNIQQCYRQGIIVMDLTVDNIGFDGNKIVVRDFGEFYISDRTQLKNIELEPIKIESISRVPVM